MNLCFNPNNGLAGWIRKISVRCIRSEVTLLIFVISPCTAEICFKLPRSPFSLEGQCWPEVSGQELCVCESSWDGTWLVWVYNCRPELCWCHMPFPPFLSKGLIGTMCSLKGHDNCSFLIFMKLLLIMPISWLFRAVCSVYQDGL